MELREDFQKLMEKQLNDWRAQAERFTAGVESFTKLKSANESTWSECKAQMERAGRGVKAAVDSMTTSFKH